MPRCGRGQPLVGRHRASMHGGMAEEEEVAALGGGAWEKGVAARRTGARQRRWWLHSAWGRVGGGRGGGCTPSGGHIDAGGCAAGQDGGELNRCCSGQSWCSRCQICVQRHAATEWRYVFVLPMVCGWQGGPTAGDVWRCPPWWQLLDIGARGARCRDACCVHRGVCRRWGCPQFLHRRPVPGCAQKDGESWLLPWVLGVPRLSWRIDRRMVSAIVRRAALPRNLVHFGRATVALLHHFPRWRRHLGSFSLVPRIMQRGIGGLHGQLLGLQFRGLQRAMVWCLHLLSWGSPV